LAKDLTMTGFFNVISKKAFLENKSPAYMPDEKIDFDSSLNIFYFHHSFDSYGSSYHDCHISIMPFYMTGCPSLYYRFLYGFSHHLINRMFHTFSRYDRVGLNLPIPRNSPARWRLLQGR
jgi:hypothetical protein